MSRRHHVRKATWAALVMGILLSLTPLFSVLANDNELQVTLGPGYSAIPDLAEGMDGVGGGAEIAYGITAFWGIAGGVFSGYHFEKTIVDETDETSELFDATTIVSVWIAPKFNLDVFVLVPYASLGPELLLTYGELQSDQDQTEFGLRWTIGFDYRPMRRWSIGFEATYHSFLSRPLDYPVFISTLFRVSFHHGFDDL